MDRCSTFSNRCKPWATALAWPPSTWSGLCFLLLSLFQLELSLTEAHCSGPARAPTYTHKCSHLLCYPAVFVQCFCLCLQPCVQWLCHGYLNRVQYFGTLLSPSPGALLDDLCLVDGRCYCLESLVFAIGVAFRW